MIALALLLTGCGEPAAPPTPSQASELHKAPAKPAAQTPALDGPTGLGRAPTPEEIAAWDIDVSPSWEGLPPGRGTPAEGARLFTAKCAACHGTDARGGQGFLGPNLVATEPLEGFGGDWHLPRVIGNWWPHASTLFDYVRRAMPQTAPGSLTSDETYALVAWLLAENGVVAKDFVLDEQSIKTVKMPTRVRFVPDDRETTAAFR